MRKKIDFKEFKEMLLYRSVTEWNKKENYIVLDNGMKITIEMTESDCCAYAHGEFEDVQLNAAITDVIEPKYSHWKDCDTYGCKAVVKMLHNQNLICKVNANADAGNGGYYYSVASFIVNYNNDNFSVYLVGSEKE